MKIDKDGVIIEELEEEIEVPAISLLLDNHRTMIKSMPKKAIAEVYYEVNEWACKGFISEYEPTFEMASGCEMAQGIMFSQIQSQLIISKEKYIKRRRASRKNGGKGGAPKGNQNAKKFEPVSISEMELAKLRTAYRKSYIDECLAQNPSSAAELEQLIRKAMLKENDTPIKQPLF